MDWSASVLSTISSDTEPSIIVTFDSAKYIFNAGENSNRAFLQSRRNWKRARCLFFTAIGTQRASGLPGLLMTLADATIPKLELVGPPGLTHFVASMRSYTYRDTMPLKVTECPAFPLETPTPVYRDANITVYSIPILPSSHASVSDPEMPSADLQSTLTKRKREASPDAPSKRLAGGSTSDRSPIHLSEVISTPEFNPSQLQGSAATAYRGLLIDTMFPASKAKPKTTDRKSGNQSQRGNSAKQIQPGPSTLLEPSSTGAVTIDSASSESSTANVDIYKRARLPRGFHDQLPKWTSPYEGSQLQAEGCSTTANPKPALSYVLVGSRVRGKFDVKRANTLGVPEGRLRGLLTKGQSITFSVKVGEEMIERTVQPEDCVAEGDPPGVILIVDTPTPAHIRPLISSFEESSFFAKFRSKKPEDAKEYAVRSVFHLCGDNVLDDPLYQTFIGGFGPLTHHVIASRQHSPDPVTFTSVAFNQLRLNQLDPEVFPLPKFDLTPKNVFPVMGDIPAERIMSMAANINMNMRPFRPPAPEVFDDDDKRDLFHPAVTSLAPHSLPPLTKSAFVDARRRIEAHSADAIARAQKGSDVKVIPLGTGSALPSKYRNVSSTLIQIPNWGNILLDAGEGTWGQLTRQFGLDESDPSNVWSFLRDLKCIFISHIHGDHHMGVSKILAQRKKLNPPPQKPLYLVALRAVHLYLREVSDIENLGIIQDDVSFERDGDPDINGVIPVMSEALHWKRPTEYPSSGMWQVGGGESWTDINRSQAVAERMCADLGLESFQTVDVFHRTRCFGAVIKHRDEWSIVFSGDTQPTNNLVWAGRGATLLIHEATMADDQVDMAKRKAHSTFGQAVDIGRKMNAENILLTHFSARYPKMPPDGRASKGTNDGRTKNPKDPIIALAFDHANITIGDMWKLNHYTAAMEQCFRDTAAEGDDEVDPTELGDVEVDVS